MQENEIEEFTKPEISVYDFPEDLIRLMEKYRPISTMSLMNDISIIKDKLEELKSQFRETDIWFKKFQEGLSAQEKNIDKITCALEKEIDERRKGEYSLQKQYNEIIKSAYKTAAICGVIGALVISFVLFTIQQILIHIIK